MKPIQNESEAIHYFSTADMAEFININSNYEYNDAIKLCRKYMFGDEDESYYPDRATLDEYNEFTVMWLNAFFDAHPYVKKVMFVFDN